MKIGVSSVEVLNGFLTDENTVKKLSMIIVQV